MSDKAASEISAAIFAGSLFIMVGLIFGGGSELSQSSARALGKGVEYGNAHAACIAARGKWNGSMCLLPEIASGHRND